MSSQGPTLQLSEALTSNKQWAKHTSSRNPSFFPSLSTSQHPRILWLGCSDSRCPETTLLGLQPGDVFTHRNIANIISEHDGSVSAVIEYAIAHLKIKTVFVCGHSNCGGVGAVLRNSRLGESKNSDGLSSGALTPWLAPLRSLAREYRSLLKSLDAESAALTLVELNVLAGVRNVLTRKVVRDAVRDRGLRVHGLVYDVGCGRLREVDGSALVNGSGKEGGESRSRRSVEGGNVERRVGRLVGGVSTGGRRESLFA
ncbi:carbonic anhydrase [Aspergillus filifer]